MRQCKAGEGCGQEMEDKEHRLSLIEAVASQLGKSVKKRARGTWTIEAAESDANGLITH
jgi:hypothetical protein